MSQRFHPRPSGRTIPVGSGSTDDEVSGRPCGAVGAALPLWWPLDGGGREASAVRLRQTVGMTDQQSAQDKPPDPDGDSGRIVVVTPDGMGVSTPNSTGGDSSDKDSGSPADLVEQPAKVMRIGSMIKNLLDEVRKTPAEPGSRRSTAGPSRSSRPGSRPSWSTSSSGSPCRSPRRRRPTPSCASRRPSWSGGWRVCSTASRPRCSPSRWRRSSSCRGCVGPCRPVIRRPRTRGCRCPARSRGSRRTRRGPASTSS
jgi:hypothetical protein